MMINDVYADVLKLVHSTAPAVIAWDEIPAFIFFCGCLIWVDLQSSISIGKAPRLSELHDQVLNGFPALFRLQNIVGCESWVLRIISRIANIQEWKWYKSWLIQSNFKVSQNKSETTLTEVWRGHGKSSRITRTCLTAHLWRLRESLLSRP